MDGVDKMRKGEYKTPGGKLVVVNLRVEGGIVVKAEVSGDFFLEPAEALEHIRDALVGAASDASEEQLSARVRAALSDDVVMLGFSPEAVAAAARRALA